MDGAFFHDSAQPDTAPEAVIDSRYALMRATFVGAEATQISTSHFRAQGHHNPCSANDRGRDVTTTSSSAHAACDEFRTSEIAHCIFGGFGDIKPKPGLHTRH